MSRNGTMGAEDRGPHSGASFADAVFLGQLRRQMLRFATLQLGDVQHAEDAVQEALIGALKNASSFDGRAGLKTWVFAILKRKIADALRRRRHPLEAGPVDAMPGCDEDPVLEACFTRRGHWRADERPATWGDPEAAVRDEHFWRIFDACLEHLPERQARLFMMREFVEMESAEICAAVGVTSSNLHVTLHRARLRLRACLEDNWFRTGAN